MASNLLDAIRSGLQQAQQATPTDNTSAAQRLISARRTGKEILGRAPQVQSTAEQMTNMGTQQGLNQAAEQNVIASQQMALQGESQELEQSEAKANFTQQSAQSLQKLATQEEQLMAEVARQQATIGQQASRQLLEQLGFNLAMQDRQYVSKLQSEGQRRRLDDDLSFKTELQQSIFKDQESLFRDKLAFKNMMNADERAFTDKLAQMDINTAMSLFKEQMRQAGVEGFFSGLGTVVSGGIAGYTKSTADTAAKDAGMSAQAGPAPIAPYNEDY